MDETSGGDVLTMPPVPLVTGNVHLDDDGLPVTVTAITLLVSTADGRESRIPLVHRHGAWWAPTD